MINRTMERLAKLRKHAKIAIGNLGLHSFGSCPICGYRGPFYTFDAERYEENRLCLGCRSVSRQRKVARALLEHCRAERHRHIGKAIDILDDYSILDTDGMGPMSRAASKNEKWVRGYYDDDGNTPNGCRFLDLQNPTLSEHSFDIVITQDVLEHVPNLDAALAGIARLLKPDGIHLFTVPLDLQKPTLQRAEIVDGKIVHHKPPDYHWDPDSHNQILVFWEPGDDFGEICRKQGLSFESIGEPKGKRTFLFGNCPVYISRPLPNNIEREADSC